LEGKSEKKGKGREGWKDGGWSLLAVGGWGERKVDYYGVLILGQGVFGGG